jgi:hypothetical protein
MARVVAGASAAVLTLAVAAVAQTPPERDFSGTWILEPNETLRVTQQGASLRCARSLNGGLPVEWSYDLNGGESRYRIGEESRNSVAKWEGAALLINTLVSGPRDYTEMDRWRLSGDRAMLTINRQTVTARGTQETVLVYHREGFAAPATEAPPAPVGRWTPAATPAPVRRDPPRRPSGQTDFVVRAGTHLPLALRNAVDTKHSHEGDHIYLETIAPISVDGRIVIPRGSYVNGHVSQSKPAGALKGKGELYIVFDALVLPNGTTRDFRSRLASADASAQGKVDSKEGKVTGERDTSGEARGAAEGAGIGGAVGGVAGAAAGHPITGLGVGAAAGAAAGLATVLVKHRPDVSLPKGTVVDMVLDRDLHFGSEELPY